MPVTEPRNSQGLPLFAQTLEAQRLRQQPPPQDKFFIPQVVLLGLPVLAMGTFLIIARPNIAQTTKSTKSAVEKTAVMAQNKAKTAETDIALEPADDSGRRPLDFYTGGVRGNMFSPPEAPKPAVKRVAVVKVVKPPKVELVVVPPPPPVNPFQDWSYTGAIKMGETRMALLENTKTKEGQIVKEGEAFLGSQVGTITDLSITMTTGGKPQTLAKSDTINVTPLSANAAFLNNGGQPGAPPPGGMPPNMGGMQPQMNVMPQMMMQGNAQQQADRAARRNQWMNNNFRGGGGRNRGGGN